MKALGDDSSTTSSAPAMMEEDLTQGPFPFFLHGKEQQNIIIIHIIRSKSACLLSDCSLRPLTWPSTRAAGQNSAALLLLSCSKKTTTMERWEGGASTTAAGASSSESFSFFFFQQRQKSAHLSHLAHTAQSVLVLCRVTTHFSHRPSTAQLVIVPQSYFRIITVPMCRPFSTSIIPFKKIVSKLI